MGQDSEIYGGRVHRELFPKEIIPGIVRGKRRGEREGKRSRREINLQDRGKLAVTPFKYETPQELGTGKGALSRASVGTGRVK